MEQTILQTLSARLNESFTDVTELTPIYSATIDKYKHGQCVTVYNINGFLIEILVLSKNKAYNNAIRVARFASINAFYSF